MEFDSKASDRFNMAVAYLYEIRNLMNICHEAATTKDPLNYFDAVDRLYVELYPKMHGDERTSIEDKLKEAKKHSKQNSSKAINELREAELLLRDILEKRNLLTPARQDTRNDTLNVG